MSLRFIPSPRRPIISVTSVDKHPLGAMSLRSLRVSLADCLVRRRPVALAWHIKVAKNEVFQFHSTLRIQLYSSTYNLKSNYDDHLLALGFLPEIPSD